MWIPKNTKDSRRNLLVMSVNVCKEERNLSRNVQNAQCLKDSELTVLFQEIIRIYMFGCFIQYFQFLNQSFKALTQTSGFFLFGYNFSSLLKLDQISELVAIYLSICQSACKQQLKKNQLVSFLTKGGFKLINKPNYFQKLKANYQAPPQQLIQELIEGDV
ncbi:hypothetical protein TTHERM_01018370 (macronuclear) [Tetrahymena thermophila SB210]|uniref:Uncharacterized protein n=1 Tax=Tetrahymena thermophila (strain SB210) TaxID=312017 RepID=Q22XP0_TETTS|nr:hypothetical protein TTHERM_01018370 [Tetrahymena thermophila SB210]EAR90039.1 hypothetical protein TTHERM_01018370 [Tetrahymena thermophila SB210]|eukprot:XP_001010284.1 hypothetical protein TTHERM_01018370 [Tetrahymena thermophila SB210]